MLVLAIDTSAPVGALALARDGEILRTQRLESPDGLASVLLQEIVDLIHEERLGREDVDLWAPASGPGSFTGIRVGLAAAGPAGEVRAAVLDARREEVYAAVYDGNLEPLIPPAVRSWEEFRVEAAAHAPLWIARREEVFAADGVAPLPADAPRLAVAEPIRAQALLAASKPALGPEQVEAEYIRRPDAERNWKRP